MDTSQGLVPFPLFHGTSSHYLSAFRPGYAPTPWLHRDVALRLLTDTWHELRLRRHEISSEVIEELRWDVNYEEFPWFVKNVIEQASGPSNWQHGELYLTPSVRTAVKFACGGARYGGELLTFCRTAIDGLAKVDAKRTKQLVQGAEGLAELLRGTERPPLVVQFDDLSVDDLSTELSGKDVQEQISRLTNESDIPELGGDFRLASGRGIVNRVLEVRAMRVDESPPKFELVEILRPPS